MSTIEFDDWSLRGVWGSPASFSSPAVAAVIHHAVTDIEGDTAIEQAQEIEEIIYGRGGFSMGAYSHIVSSDGTKFVCRCHKYRNGANNNTRGSKGAYPHLHNSNTVSICFAGNFEHGVAVVPTLIPTDAQLLAAAEIIVDERRAGDLTADSIVIPHNALHATACPGDETEILRIVVIEAQVSHLEEPTIMAIHADAKKAQALGIWGTGSGPLNAKEPATREQAAIMAWRGYNEARTQQIAATADLAQRVKELTEDVAARDRLIGTIADGLSAAEKRLVVLEAGRQDQPRSGVLDVRIVGVGGD